MNPYMQIAESIISEQENIIGPLAIEQAKSVEHLEVNWSSDEHEITFSGDERQVIDSLIRSYSAVFGQLSVEVCKEAAKPFLTHMENKQIPGLLKAAG